MLRQEINLTLPLEIIQPSPGFLTWKKFKFCLLIFATSLSILYLFSYVNYVYLERKNKALQTRVDALQKEFFSLKEHYPQLFFSKNVNETISKLKEDLQAQNKALNSLITDADFAKLLASFSELIVPDVWLTDITIDGSGSKITISGAATNIANIQSFIKNIQSAKRLSGYNIATNNILEPGKNKKNTKFLFELTLLKNNHE